VRFCLASLEEQAVKSTKKSKIVALTKVRMREELKDQLARSAARNNRTQNGELVHRLEQSFATDAKELRDSAIVDMMVNHNDFGSELLRKFASEIARNPDLLRSEAELKNMIGNIYVPGKRFTREPLENPATPIKGDK
jgi:Arc-like DNA binding dprotein